MTGIARTGGQDVVSAFCQCVFQYIAAAVTSCTGGAGDCCVVHVSLRPIRRAGMASAAGSRGRNVGGRFSLRVLRIERAVVAGLAWRARDRGMAHGPRQEGRGIGMADVALDRTDGNVGCALRNARTGSAVAIGTFACCACVMNKDPGCPGHRALVAGIALRRRLACRMGCRKGECVLRNVGPFVTCRTLTIQPHVIHGTGLKGTGAGVAGITLSGRTQQGNVTAALAEAWPRTTMAV